MISLSKSVYKPLNVNKIEIGTKNVLGHFHNLVVRQKQTKKFPFLSEV